jgi:hypothetical protein
MLEGLFKGIVAAIRLWSGVGVWKLVDEAAGRGVEGKALGDGGCAVAVGVGKTGAERHAVNPARMRTANNSRNNLAEGFMATLLSIQVIHLQTGFRSLFKYCKLSIFGFQ